MFLFYFFICQFKLKDKRTTRTTVYLENKQTQFYFLLFSHLHSSRVVYYYILDLLTNIDISIVCCVSFLSFLTQSGRYVKELTDFFFNLFGCYYSYISLTWTEIVFLLYCCKYLTIDNQPVLYEFFVIYIFQLELHFVSSLTPYRNLKFFIYYRRVYLFYLFFRNLILFQSGSQKKNRKKII